MGVSATGYGADTASVVADDPVAEATWKASMSIWFFSGRAELDATESLKIADLAAQARADPRLEFGIHHTVADRVLEPRPGSVPDRSRDQLGPQRLAVVRDAMVAAGIPEVRIHVGVFGERIYDVDRRTVIFVRQMPSLDETAVQDGRDCEVANR